MARILSPSRSAPSHAGAPTEPPINPPLALGVSTALVQTVGANDGQYTQIGLGAVGEFKLQTSAFNAEYGRNPGVMISINTKSGGSAFHGTAYEFLRNDALDARRPFDTTGKVAKLRYNQFGGNLSGPIPIPHFPTVLNKKLFAK